MSSLPPGRLTAALRAFLRRARLEAKDYDACTCQTCGRPQTIRATNAGEEVIFEPCACGFVATLAPDMVFVKLGTGPLTAFCPRRSKEVSDVSDLTFHVRLRRHGQSQIFRVRRGRVPGRWAVVIDRGVESTIESRELHSMDALVALGEIATEVAKLRLDGWVIVDGDASSVVLT
jgi:hypothetical protein